MSCFYFRAEMYHTNSIPSAPSEGHCCRNSHQPSLAE